jgi:hypothetical protein
MKKETKDNLTHWGLAILFTWLFTRLPKPVQQVIAILMLLYLVGVILFLLLNV